jgi:hypothetical protein
VVKSFQTLRTFNEHPTPLDTVFVADASKSFVFVIADKPDFDFRHWIPPLPSPQQQRGVGNQFGA